jgi:hypothetical protein
VWDYVRAGQVSSGNAVGRFDAARYELTDEEREAFESRDVAGLYGLGLHPVLLNGFARASGYDRDEYRKLLAPFAAKEERTARWQK